MTYNLLSIEKSGVAIGYTNGMNTSPANLSAELSRRGLHFFVDDHVEQKPQPLSSEELIAGLARHKDARLHLALIALFLYEPWVETAVFNARRIFSILRGDLTGFSKIFVQSKRS
ncbi:MAG: hypothetical protein DRP58_11515 [Spirochaetes bacterium]|nr:MAG: hypothetical protein DRP58_11515 [Spirochaetota bacterium]